MRAAFPEYFVAEPERQKKLWADCIFVLDTNVLLDLYRFSDSAREALFKVMESLGERLWVPYQVAAEYFENRLNVIEAQSEAYAKSIAGLKSAKDKFNSGTRHPFVSDDVFNKFISSYDLMIEELENKQKIYLSYVNDDVIKGRIGDLLNGRVGDPYSEDRLLEIASEGEKRYLENVPPGFQDGGKIPEATTNKLRLKKFGDLILWKQLIDHASVSDKPVILVTGEKKDDWWLKSDKGLVSALPALSKEFMEAVSQDFYLYATDRFLLKANEYLEQDTSANVVEEIREINKDEADSVRESDSAILDRALNSSWPSLAVTDDRGAKHYLTGGDVILPDSSLFEMLQEQRKALRERALQLRQNLDMHSSRIERVEAVRRDLLRSGVSPDDQEVVEIEGEISRLKVIVDVYEHDMFLLRKQMRELLVRQRHLFEDES
ncbi:PIN-like domain-containing protein [Pseudomonas sp. EL_65y_Pfl1_R83]|uniref:PIN-like domain-containing protein n=1 Tax=Pseudomonas sp. EL_65y_Pfl1_R83 TaxID=3088697 RepID=UPI0030D9B1C6